MTLLDFSKINKLTALSFKEQRQMIKKLGKGETVLCQLCNKPLTLTSVTKNKNAHSNGVHCQKGCTDISLEFVE
jgi:hypothetical protein